jgi:hypothetical protein
MTSPQFAEQNCPCGVFGPRTRKVAREGQLLSPLTEDPWAGRDFGLVRGRWTSPTRSATVDRRRPAVLIDDPLTPEV